MCTQRDWCCAPVHSAGCRHENSRIFPTLLMCAQAEDVLINLPLMGLSHRRSKLSAFLCVRGRSIYSLLHTLLFHFRSNRESEKYISSVDHSYWSSTSTIFILLSHTNISYIAKRKVEVRILTQYIDNID